jgi:hypothetical protein
MGWIWYLTCTTVDLLKTLNVRVHLRILRSATGSAPDMLRVIVELLRANSLAMSDILFVYSLACSYKKV